MRQQGIALLSRAKRRRVTVPMCTVAMWLLLVMSSTATRVDFSYHHNVQPSDMAKALQQFQTTPIDLDVTGSALGDDGVAALSMDNVVNLTVCSNHLTTTTATQLLNQSSLQHLDLSFNDLSHPSKRFLRALREATHLRSLRMEECGLTASAARALAKGLLARNNNTLDLYLHGNPNLGDAGAAALAAALKSDCQSLRHLDLSACGIGDTGAEALAHALEQETGLESLNLSHNRLSSDTSVWAHAKIPTLDLSFHKDLNDRSAPALAEALETGRVTDLRIRSCGIHADGARAFGVALRRKRGDGNLSLDLSGNPLGTHRPKAKTSTANKLKDQASAAAASSLNFLKRGLKDVGVDVAPLLGSSLESDDEEEENDEEEEDDDSPRCGAKALSNGFVDGEGKPTGRVQLGLRRCFLDHAGADALASLLVEAQDLGLELELDVALNPVLEEEMNDALHGDDAELLAEMAERHRDMEAVIRESKERALERSRTVETEDWGDVPDFSDAYDPYDEEDEF